MSEIKIRFSFLPISLRLNNLVLSIISDDEIVLAESRIIPRRLSTIVNNSCVKCVYIKWPKNYHSDHAYCIFVLPGER